MPSATEPTTLSCRHGAAEPRRGRTHPSPPPRALPQCLCRCASKMAHNVGKSCLPLHNLPRYWSLALISMHSMDGAPTRFRTSLSAMGGAASFGFQPAPAIRRIARMYGLWSSTVSLCRSVHTCALKRRRDITSVCTNWHCISLLHPLFPRTVRSKATSAPHAGQASPGRWESRDVGPPDPAGDPAGPMERVCVIHKYKHLVT